MSDEFFKHYLDDALAQFRKLKELADKALRQLTDEEFFTQIDGESNSAATIVKHVAGNLRSRWTDFLTSDGEKEWRRRDTEFVLEAGNTRDSLQQKWETGWQVLFDTLASISDTDISRSVTIRGEPHTIIQAINRQLTHYGYHTGQIVFLAKHLKSSAWQTLSVERGKSEEFRQQMLKTYEDNVNPGT